MARKNTTPEELVLRQMDALQAIHNWVEERIDKNKINSIVVALNDPRSQAGLAGTQMGLAIGNTLLAEPEVAEEVIRILINSKATSIEELLGELSYLREACTDRMDLLYDLLLKGLLLRNLGESGPDEGYKKRAAYASLSRKELMKELGSLTSTADERLDEEIKSFLSE